MQATAPAGLLEGWAEARGIGLDVLAVDDGPLPPPDADRHAFAIVLGSGKSLAADLPPWAPGVLDWLRVADAACLPVLGICFGAQAIAAALGGSVHRLAAPEIGWIEVETSDAERIPSGPWLAWHEDGLHAPAARLRAGEQRRGDAGVLPPAPPGRAVPPRGDARHRRGSGRRRRRPGWARRARRSPGCASCRRSRRRRAAQRAERLFDGFAARAGIPPRVPR